MFLFYLAVPGDLILFLRDWRRLLVRVYVSLRLQMLQSDEISMTNELCLGIVPLLGVDGRRLVVPFLYHESEEELDKFNLIPVTWYIFQPEESIQRSLILL